MIQPAKSAPLRVHCLLRDQFGHVRPVEEHFGEAAAFVYDEAWDAAALVAARPDLVLCVNDFAFDVAVCLDAARQARIPSLVLQDGILEWRCQYENPLFGAGGGPAQHQPVLADKIACLGPASARFLASWGNGGSVEVTGMPKLDAIGGRTFTPPRRPGRRLLVMTAKKPWYDDGQRAVIERSLADLKAHLATRPDLDVVWRLTRGVAETLGVVNRLKELETAELASVLEEVDAVVTTPSTTILEGMLAGRPVAVLDYHNVPRFVASAWTISAADHIPRVIPELIEPPAARLLYQRECLRDSLWHEGSAAGRVAALIDAMARRGRQCREGDAGLRLPPNILGQVDLPVDSGSLPPLSDLYPGQAAFQLRDVQALQARLQRLERDYRRLRETTLSKRVGRRLRGLFGSTPQ